MNRFKSASSQILNVSHNFMSNLFDSIYLKIKKLRKLDNEFIVFGSKRWKYQYRKVSEYEINKLENECEIELPIEFAYFIMEIGFGAGPSYGVNPEYFLIVDLVDENKYNSTKINPLQDGYIVISEHGCGIETVLIVDGIHKGEVWKSDDFGVFKQFDNYIEWYNSWLDTLIFIFENNDKEKIKNASHLF